MEDAERLARRVIALAWMDAFGLADIDRLNRTLMQEAMWFLVAPAGEWAEARVSWCAVAGICPDDLRRQAIEIGDKRRSKEAECYLTPKAGSRPFSSLPSAAGSQRNRRRS